MNSNYHLAQSVSSIYNQQVENKNLNKSNKKCCFMSKRPGSCLCEQVKFETFPI